MASLFRIRQSAGAVRKWKGLAATLALFSFSASAWAQSNPCDLTGDGTVNAADVNAAVNMALGLSPCTANILGSGVCNVGVVQKVVDAALGSTCTVTAPPVSHTISLTWVASISPNVAGYNLYRGTVSGGPYTQVNVSPISGPSYTDAQVQSGQTYFYVATAVDSSNNESPYSTEAQAVVPTP